MKILKQEIVGNVVVEFVEHAWGVWQSRVLSKCGEQIHSNFSLPDKERAENRFQDMIEYERKVQRIS